jgi:hypothetical protein
MKNLTRALAVSACAVSLLIPAPARAADALEVLNLQVSQQGDLELTCGELAAEAILMRDVIDIAQDTRDDTKITDTGIGVAGAIGSLLIGTATGGIGLAAAGLLAKEASSNKEETAEGIQDVAFQRRALMLGIYNAKGCEGPMEHVLQDREPQSPLTRLATVEPSSGKIDEQEAPQYNQ